MLTSHAGVREFCLLLALVLSAYTLVIGGVALWRQRGGERGGRIRRCRSAWARRRGGPASQLCRGDAARRLRWSGLRSPTTIRSPTFCTTRIASLTTAYKFSALWTGQEGSLLLWAWLLATYGFVLRMRHRVDVRLSAFASTILAGVQVFFLLLLNFAAPPFAIQPGPVAQDGFGLNPLLQYPEMVIHPPMLYLGYVGFSVPFAFALGALMMRYPGEKWIHITRRWTMVTWLFLTCGIFLGAHWAYACWAGAGTGAGIRWRTRR